MNITLTIFEIILALALAFLGILKREKNKKLFTMLIVIVVVFTGVVIVWTNYDQTKDSENITSKLTDITQRADSLIFQRDSLKLSIGRLSKQLEPFLVMAQEKYPQMSAQEALDKLTTDMFLVRKTVEQMQPKLEFLTSQTKILKDTSTNQIHTFYVFRAKYPVSLVDVSIKLRFDGIIDKAVSRLFGAVVEERGSNLLINSDYKGLTYFTGFLREGNDVIIEVISKEPLTIKHLEMSP